MNEQQQLLIDESIMLELNVSDLYMIFKWAFPEDSAFWWELVLEEKNHASLIIGIRDAFSSVEGFPYELLAPNVKDLLEINNKLSQLIKKYKEEPPSREAAFKIALEIEQSAGEIYYQRFMEQENTTGIKKILQELNDESKAHAKRIREYMMDNII